MYTAEYISVEIQKLKNGWYKILHGFCVIEGIPASSVLYVKDNWHSTKKIIAVTGNWSDDVKFGVGVCISQGQYFKIKEVSNE